MTLQSMHGRPRADSLADVLERVLDKGVVIAGDVVVNVLDIELLSLKLRLFVASAQTARELGMDWWAKDPFYSSQASQTGQPDARADLGSDADADKRESLPANEDDLAGRVAALERAVRPQEPR